MKSVIVRSSSSRLSDSLIFLRRARIRLSLGNPLKWVEPFNLILLLLDEKQQTLGRWNDKTTLREPGVGFRDQRSPNWGDRFYDVFAMRNVPLRFRGC